MSDTLHVAEVTVFIKSPAQEKEQGLCVQCAAVKRKLPTLGVDFDTEFLDSPEGLAIVEKAKALNQMAAPITRILYGDGTQRLVSGNNMPAIKEALNV